MATKENYRFWKGVFFFCIISLVLIVLLPENFSLVVIVSFLISIITFQVGMIYNAYKIGSWRWIIVNMIFGMFACTYFLFVVMKSNIGKDDDKIKAERKRKGKTPTLD